MCLLFTCISSVFGSVREQVVIATSNDVAVCKSMRFIVCNSNVKFSLLSIVFFNIYVFLSCIFAVVVMVNARLFRFEVYSCSSCSTFNSFVMVYLLFSLSLYVWIEAVVFRWEFIWDEILCGIWLKKDACIYFHHFKRKTKQKQNECEWMKEMDTRTHT